MLRVEKWLTNRDIMRFVSTVCKRTQRKLAREIGHTRRVLHSFTEWAQPTDSNISVCAVTAEAAEHAAVPPCAMTFPRSTRVSSHAIERRMLVQIMMISFLDRTFRLAASGRAISGRGPTAGSSYAGSG